LTPPNNFFGGVVDTGKQFFGGVPAKNFRLFGYFPMAKINHRCLKFFAGVVDTAEQFTPAINIHSRTSPRIFEKIQNGPNGGLGDTDS
jgi:hypothetical protein